MNISRTAPILCQGTSVYEPLRDLGLASKSDKLVAVIGLGSLGSLAIKIAKALGHKVIAVSSKRIKESIAKQRGADHFVCSLDAVQLAVFSGKADMILDTSAVEHDINTYLPMLAMSGTYVVLGLGANEQSIRQVDIMSKRQTVSGSMFGGIAATQELIDLCSSKNIYPEVIEVKAS